MEGLKHTLWVICPYCKGKKKINGDDCVKCKGTGHIRKLYTGKFNRNRTLL